MDRGGSYLPSGPGPKAWARPRITPRRVEYFSYPRPGSQARRRKGVHAVILGRSEESLCSELPAAPAGR